MRWLLSLICFQFAFAAWGQEAASEDRRYVVDIELHTAQEFRQLLERAEQLLLSGVVVPKGEAKVTFVLHGPVLKNLLRQNYLDNKRLVDLSASLSAMDVIDVKACQTWMRSHGLAAQELQPFIEIVAYGPDTVEQLLQDKNYVNF
jgi:intracellular sulfur oxidation DsrE/DsrF family protein